MSRVQVIPSGAWVMGRIPDLWIRQNSGLVAEIEWLPDGRVALDLRIKWQIHRDPLPPTQ